MISFQVVHIDQAVSIIISMKKRLLKRIFQTIHNAMNISLLLGCLGRTNVLPANVCKRAVEEEMVPCFQSTGATHYA
jgi:hypothetical protein